MRRDRKVTPEVTPERAAAFVESIRPARRVTLTLDQGTVARVRAHIDRVERDEPGLGYAPGESDEKSLDVALTALIDHALTDSEADVGLRYDYLQKGLVRQEPSPLRYRLRWAWRTLRGTR